MTKPALSVYPVTGLPEITPGTDLAASIASAIQNADLQPRTGDILTIAQKIVSKAEGRYVDLRTITPSPAANELAGRTDKDPRAVELILRESRRVVRQSPGVIIVEHRLGIILANAGIDRSNAGGDEDAVLLLPEDPDESAQCLKTVLDAALGVNLGIVISDSVGRPRRLGTTGIAIGCAGLTTRDDRRGDVDRDGRVLQVAEVAIADCVAGAAALVMGEGAEGVPAAIVRGLDVAESGQSAKTLLRPADEDLFR
jgi:coenzyme F420-0:L-glutamate ligase/coenzyme F420-1:gamma-L-glutamate ligase